MEYFKLVEDGIDTAPYLDEITENSDLWYVDTTRQERITKQRETHAIALYSHADHASADSRVRRAKPFGYKGMASPFSERLPIASKFVDDLVGSQNGTMGRAVMTNLKPNGTIYPHTDDGLYWLLRDRYHLVVKSAAGSLFKAGGEEVRMQQGELCGSTLRSPTRPSMIRTRIGFTSSSTSCLRTP